MEPVVEFDPEQDRTYEIFDPEGKRAFEGLVRDQPMFAYYTSADTAFKIINNQELWLRNASLMNDFSEIQYGTELIDEFIFSGSTGDRFMDVVESIFDEMPEAIRDGYEVWLHDWKLETYIACISEHLPEENTLGRLSMWRAYGDTALIVKSTPMAVISDTLGAYSTKVRYLGKHDFEEMVEGLIARIRENKEFLVELGFERFLALIHGTLTQFAIATKHPGFKEEKEWRIWYRPNEKTAEQKELTKSVLIEDSVVLEGRPQIIYRLKLVNDTTKGLYGADLDDLLERVIIGPSLYPYVKFRAFNSVLRKAGVSEADLRITYSDIPLRTD